MINWIKNLFRRKKKQLPIKGSDLSTKQTIQNEKIDISSNVDENIKFNTADLIKHETQSIENKYLKWVISVGLAFLIIKVLDTSVEISYLKGKQEHLDNTVQKLFDERNELIDNLKNENNSLKSVKFENEKLKLDIEKAKFDELIIIDSLKRKIVKK